MYINSHDLQGYRASAEFSIDQNEPDKSYVSPLKFRFSSYKWWDSALISGSIDNRSVDPKR